MFMCLLVALEKILSTVRFEPQSKINVYSASALNHSAILDLVIMSVLMLYKFRFTYMASAHLMACKLYTF